MDMVERAAWEWSERTGMRVELAGTTSQNCNPGITIKRATAAEWAAYGNPKVKGLVDDDCAGGYMFFLHPQAPWQLGVVLHEGGHALGCWGHLPDSYDSMHPLAAGPNGFTQQDALCVLDTPFWPLYDQPQPCAAMILPNNDMVIPEISGYRARLKYLGTDSLGRHLWQESSVSLNPGPQGCAGYVLGTNTATLPALLVQHLGTFSAQLVKAGGVWVLVSAIPI